MLEKGSPNNHSIVRRKTILRLFVMVFLFALFLFGTVHPVFAQVENADKSLQTISKNAGVGTSDLPTIIGNIINVIFGILGIVLLGYLLYAGFLWMTSGGDDKKVGAAKTMIRNAIIGLIIMASAFALARWIISALSEATESGTGISGSGSGAGGFPGSAGSLGGGIIEYHVPERDATNVPRNTAIAITFKEAIKINSFVQDYDDHGTPSNLSDDATSSTTVGLNAIAVKVFPTGHPEKALQTAGARVRFTGDRKTFVIKPVQYLGSPTEHMGYTVQLMSGKSGILREDGKPAFSGTFASGYKWQFDVSTVIDNTPPKVTAVIPSAGGKYAPNIVVQVNFNEVIDPTTASGIFKDGKGFINAEVTSVPIAKPNDPPTHPNGEFKISNHYMTMEFVTDLPCGINSCGKQIFCLPSDSAMRVLVKAATLSDTPPAAELTQSGYDGITDIAGNSLDGNRDGAAQGPGKDDYGWGFGTDSKPNLTAPKIKSTKPPAGDKKGSSNVPVSQSPEANFDSILQTSTLNTDSAFIRTNESNQFADTFWWTPYQILLNESGGVATSSEPVVAGRVSVNHRLYIPAGKKPPTPEYYPYMLSDLQNVYQNCFNPAGSEICKGPNCCDNKASGAVCPYPVKQ